MGATEEPALVIKNPGQQVLASPGRRGTHNAGSSPSVGRLFQRRGQLRAGPGPIRTVFNVGEL